MDKYSDSRSSRSRWKDDSHRNPKLYDERTDKPGVSSSIQNGKISGSSKQQNRGLIKAEIANQINQNLPEDMRISKLLRRLESEATVGGLIEICQKLKVVVQDPANGNYIRRAFDSRANIVINVMKDCSTEAMPHLSEVFGMMGFAMRTEFPTYKSWICKNYKSIKSLRPAMMNSLEKTLEMDKELLLMDQIARLMELLRDFLEQSESATTFVAITRVLMVIARKYNRHFKQHFTNIVDIIVGWHIEPEQKPYVRNHCSVVLQSFHECWEADTKFTLEMLGQLLEDIEACLSEENPDGSPEDKKYRDFGAFVGVFNTIIKCISTDPEQLVYYVKKEFMEDSYKKILLVAEEALAGSGDGDIVLPINEFLLMIIEWRRYDLEVKMEDFEMIIKLELKNLHTFKEVQLSSFFSLVVRFIDEFKMTLSVGLIEHLFDLEGPINTRVRFNNDSRVQNGLITMYHDILALKNVPILQCAYKYIVSDFGRCLKEIPELANIPWDSPVPLSDSIPENTKTSIILAQFGLNFDLTAISKLATTQNSIIAMYSLSPSILEVLINLQIWNPCWNDYELAQYAIFKMISAHCLKNNNFVSSSSLFINKSVTAQSTNSWESASSPTESPVSQHFKLILEFLVKMLKATPTLKQMKLILDWLDKIIQQTSQFFEQLLENQNFVFIVKRVNNLVVKYNTEVALRVANCDDSLYAFENLHADIYTSITELCSVQICSVNPEIRKRYSFILSRIPLRFTVEQAKSPSGINKEAITETSEMQSWHLSLGAIHGGELRAQYFQEFINHIAFSPEAKNIDEFISRAFKNCWFNGTEMAETYKNVTLKDVRTLTSWIQWEAARFCVNNKLRTPLGKPQDTFVKIENIIKEYARILALKDKSKLRSYKHVMANQRNVRILLGFMEALEKAIYNAAEGNAFGIPAPEKPARTFFRLNWSTCYEWFSRNRLAIHLLALHCMELEMVIRCASSVLKDMVTAGKQNDPYFEQILMSLVWAYLRNFESDALYGLYTWTRSVTGKKLLWIKMAAEQAAGHREIAADGYTRIMEDEKLEPYVYDFLNDQRKISYYFSGDYQSLYNIVIEEHNSSYKPQSIPMLTVSPNQVASIMKYDKTNDPTVLFNLSDWDVLDALPGEVPSNFSVHHLMSLTGNTIVHELIMPKSRVEVNMSTCWDTIHTFLQECMRTGSQEYMLYSTLLNHLANKADEHVHLDGTQKIQSLNIEKKFGSFVTYFASAYSQFFDDYSDKGEQQGIDLRLELVSCTRKELNYRQCMRELCKGYTNIEYCTRIGLPVERNSLDEIKTFLTTPEIVSNPKIWNENIARTVYEHCKVLYIIKNQYQQAIQFAASSAFGIHQRLNSEDFEATEKLKTIYVKFFMKISEWIQGEGDDVLQSDQSPLKTLVDSIDDEVYVSDTTSLVDSAVGKLLQSGANKCPEMTKVWSSLGAWCYKWGRKMVESKTDSHGLRPVDGSAIAELLPEAEPHDIEKICQILNEQHIAAEDEDIGPNESSSTEVIESQLRTIPVLKNKNSEFMDKIIELWKQAHREVYKYYEMCASSYFKFLLLSSSNLEDSGDSSVVTATLRLLRLIVKHALGLQEVLEEGLSKTPSEPWKVIIPQLFSRLNHHEPYVRRRVSELLCRVALDSPHLIIFPTVVGAQETVDMSKITENDETNIEMEWKNSSLTFCFNALLDTLSFQSPKTVNQVQLLVQELRRISILWDERWLLSLTQVYAENVKKFQAFESDFQKTDQSPDKIILYTEKYRLLMRPVLFVLERLQEHTSKPPETNNERSFQERYMTHIETTINDMKKPFDPSNPLMAFNRFKSLFQFIQQRVHKKMNFELKMSDVSPVLANLKNTSISMPGVQPSKENVAVYIQSVDNMIQILPTKTKPKKLAFYGSDGKRYTYLFKGMEDLHLDERIMQFLSIANLMMKKSVDSDGKVTFYRAHHYSVIPLGPRSGLISWVDGVTPIFSMYKKWQQREAANPRKDKQYVAMRPSELYFNKITPLLKEHNLKPTDNRKDWPLSVQRKVFEELKAETPKDLLAKEFWCTASTAAHWRQIVRNYSVSLAVMSVIGYVIGLGDRHLDNILVKLATGDVVHIDYNVCFEKGKTLRVPEKVPFRMTQNIEEALGLTGIEGTFRLSCEHVLKSLKRGRETLLTLLEAFVYDPLVDWAVGEDTVTSGLANLGTGAEKGTSNATIDLTAARKQLEREVTRDTLAIRFTEIKTDWTQNRDDVYNQLLLMKDNLSELSNNRNEIQRLETQRCLLSKEISLVRELEALGSAMSSHPLNTLSQRYAVYKKKRNDVELIRNILMEKAVESERMMADYSCFVEKMKSGKISYSLMDIKSNYEAKMPPPAVSEFDLVKDFLESSNQGQTYVQGKQLSEEMEASVLQLKNVVVTALEAMTQYFNVTRYYPYDHVRNHRLGKYFEWCQALIGNKSKDFSRQIAVAYHQTFGDSMYKDIQIIPDNIIGFSFQLQNYITELSQQRDQSYMRLRNLKAFPYKKGNLEPHGDLKKLVSLIKTLRLIEEKRNDDSLVTYTVSDDRWYIDELKVRISFLNKIFEVVVPDDTKNPLYINSLECVKTVTESLEAFCRIQNDFQLNVIPQTLQGIISGEKTVLDMIASLSNIQSLAPLSELTLKLEEDLHNCIHNPNQKGILRAVEISDAYIAMVGLYQNLPEDNLGRKIFLQIHGMFEEMWKFSNKFLNLDKMLNVPKEWSQVNELDPARRIFISPMKNTIAMTLQQIFLVKRIIAMTEYFSYCLQIAWAFKGSGDIVGFDLKLLVHPLRSYICDYVRKFVFGRGPFASTLILYCLVGPQEITDLDQLKFEFPKEVLLPVESDSTREESEEYFKSYAKIQNEYLHQLSCILSGHHWLNEEYLTVIPPLPRADLLIELQNFTQTLTGWQASIKKIHQELEQCTASTLQRLKWTSGVNPMINDLMNSFESITNGKLGQVKNDLENSTEIVKHCCAILNFEMLRYKTPKAIMNDEEFLNFRQQWENVCLAEKNVSNTVNPIEKALVELLDPEGKIERAWINNVTNLIDDMINQVHSDIDEKEKRVTAAQDNLDLSAHKLRNFIASHHRISADIRILLKSILKHDESDQNKTLREYLGKYKNFIDGVTELHSNVLSKDFTDVMVKRTIAQVEGSLAIINEVYNDLFTFEKTVGMMETTEGVKGQKRSLLHNHTESQFNVDQIAAASPIRKAPNQKEQKRNAYAVSVWRRIRMKLEGRDPDPNKISRVQEQVDWMIREALNQDNLALLYEGFTSWV